MADIKEYAYYRRGDQFAIMEVDTTTLPNTTFQGDTLWKSPQESIADGIEIEYSFSGKYFINETEDVNTAIDTYVSIGGLLKIIDQGDDDYSASPESLSDGSFIVLRKAGRWNGLHKVKAAGV